MNNLGGQRLGDLFKILPLKAICEPRNDHGRYFINLIVMVQIEINRVRVIVVNATFNNISVINRGRLLLEEETGVPGENYQPAASH